MRKSLLAAVLVYSAAAHPGALIQPFTAGRVSGPVVVDTETVYGARDAGAINRDGIEGRVAGSLRLPRDLRLGIGASVLRDRRTGLDEFGSMVELAYLPADSSLDTGLGLKRNYEGQRLPFARLGWSGRLMGRALDASALLELPRSSRRDGADLLAGISMSLYGDALMRWHLELAAEDLEALWQGADAEGGTRFIIGPSFAYRSSETTSLKLFAGWIHAASRNLPTRDGFPDDGAARNQFMARVMLSYDRLRY